MLFFLVVAASASAAEPAWAPATGSTAPAFSLQDQTGATRTLSSLLEPNGAIVVFYRSSDW